MAEERENSNIYLTPEDRKPHIQEEPFNSEIFPSMTTDIEVQKEKVKVPLTDEEAELLKKRKNVAGFILIAMLDAALFAYIIYLVISIFANIA